MIILFLFDYDHDENILRSFIRGMIPFLSIVRDRPLLRIAISTFAHLGMSHEPKITFAYLGFII
jgi:hypothetical protein